MKRRQCLNAGLLLGAISSLTAHGFPVERLDGGPRHRSPASVRTDSTGSLERLPLWPETPPGGGGPQGREDWSRTHALTNVVHPSLGLYRPARPNGAAVLIAAGGGYRQIELGKEAWPAAAWLNSLGITAFVLGYRLPGEGWNAGRLAPFQDAQRALRLIRAHAPRLGLDTTRIGVLGFSAGAHLLGMAATRPGWSTYAAHDPSDLLPADSALNLLVYPIVTLEAPYQHTRTAKVLLAGDDSSTDAAEWSVQTHVRSGNAPFFLAQAADDPISDPANSALLEQACLSHHVAVVRHLFPSGGHGFGMGRAGTATVTWPGLAATWMRQYGFV
ncbi:alpha/beta hydrolase [Frateuria aurantia]